jgi:nitrite reductase/ring-hydroxylating ferredoxin subunit
MLGQGELSGTTVTCPWHQWEFDVTNGAGLTNPLACLPRYKVFTGSDGNLYMDLSHVPDADCI